MAESEGSVTLEELASVPAAWPLETLVDAWVHLQSFVGCAGFQKPLALVAGRLEELWAEDPQKAAQWLAKEQELQALQDLLAAEGGRKEQLRRALWRHAQAELGRCCVRRFTPEGLVRRPGGQDVSDWPWFEDRCRQLAGRLAAAEEFAEAASKRRRLEEATVPTGQEESACNAARLREARVLKFNCLYCGALSSTYLERHVSIVALFWGFRARWGLFVV